jgi:hypothetical protein
MHLISATERRPAGRFFVARFTCCCALHQIAMLPANCGQSLLPQQVTGWTQSTGIMTLAYKMIAERDNATIRVERQSRLIIVAKARVWASEGWKVVVTDSEGKSYQPEEFEKLPAA